MGIIQKRGDNYRVLIRKAKRKPISRTFPNKAIAVRWMTRTEAELSDNKYVQHDEVLFSALVKQYFDEFDTVKPFGANKTSTMNILNAGLGKYHLHELTEPVLLAYLMGVAEGGAGPATVQTYTIYLRGLLKTAVTDWKMTYNLTTLDTVCNRLRRQGLVGSSVRRERRPTADELDRICDYLDNRQRTVIPAGTIVRFAVASAMRLAEIMRLRWDDLNTKKKTIVVRSRKHPSMKATNHQTVPLLGETFDIVNAQPRTAPFVFPYNHESVSAAFERACDALGIDDLRFHDLRHEGVSRLFELGYSTMEVMMVSGHKDVNSLRRYLQIAPERLHEGPIRGHRVV
jgi:integrase